MSQLRRAASVGSAHAPSRGSIRIGALLAALLLTHCGEGDSRAELPAFSGSPNTMVTLPTSAGEPSSPSPADGAGPADLPTTGSAADSENQPTVVAPSMPPVVEGTPEPIPDVAGEPSATTPVAIHGPLRVEGPRLVDVHGSVVQLRGISSMWLNWEDRYSASAAALVWMRDNWGVSLIRAAMGVEPAGAYLDDPDAALERLRQVVHNAIDAGVYVLIDWHDHNANLHQAEALDFFEQIAGEFGGYPNVLYETFNEPEQLEWSADVKPYHEAAVAAIRAHDPDNVVILGTPSWSQRVDQAALDPVAGTNLMYTVHFYACDHGEYQLNLARRAYAAGLPLFVTEWGATTADGGVRDHTVCDAEARVWHDWMNESSIGWAAWKLDGCRDASCFFTSRMAPADGGWTDEWLNGHARFVIERLLE